jgi:MFS family permease
MKTDENTASREGRQEPKTARSGLGKNVIVLGIVSLLTDMSSEMTVTLLPLVLANVIGARTVTIGLIEGVAEATASFGRIFSGWFSDRIGRRKELTAVGYALSTIVKPLLYFATTWPVVLGLRFADRAGKGLRTAPRDALIADSAPKGRAGLNFGFHRAADTVGAMLGLIVAAVIIYFSQKLTVDITRSTFQTLVLVGSVPAVLAVIVLVAFVREQKTAARDIAAPKLSLKGFDSRFRVFLVIISLFTLGNSADAFLVLRAQDLGLPLLEVVISLVVFNAVYASISTPIGRLSDRIGRRHLLIVSWLLYGLIYLGFGFSSQAWQVWPLFAGYGLYYGIAEGVSRAFVADVVRPEQRGTAYGALNAAIGVITLPANIIAGLLWQGIGAWNGFGPTATFVFGAVMTFAAAMLLVFWLPRVRGNQPVPA